jgi:5-formyltetrahydrofolate cyclo-ligase
VLTKAELRRTTKATMQALAADELAAASQGICARLSTWQVLRQAQLVMAYLPLAGEANIRPVVASLAAQQRLALTRVDWSGKVLQPALVENLSDLVEGRYGVFEPPADAREVAPGDLDLILVPGLAFDPRGNRLGRGAGFYDRFLADPAVRGVVCGVALEAQIVQDVPTDPWDIRLHLIATESRWIEVA